MRTRPAVKKYQKKVLRHNGRSTFFNIPEKNFGY